MGNRNFTRTFQHILVFILAISAYLALMPALATGGSTTGSITLQGTILGVLEIQVIPETGSNSLDLTINTPQSGLKVAEITERSNKKGGYTVNLQSANAANASSTTPFFKGTDADNTDTLNYTIVYDNSPVALDNTGKATITDSNTKTTGQGVTKDLKIVHSGQSSFLTEDTYSDTLTLTITYTP